MEKVNSKKTEWAREIESNIMDLDLTPIYDSFQGGIYV